MSDDNNDGNVIHLLNWRKLDWDAIEHGSLNIMIQELNEFFERLVERYGEGDFVMEVTITDRAANFITHVAPKVGESLELFTAMGKVKIRNGGSKENPAPRAPEVQADVPVTVGGYPYKIDEVMDNGFRMGEVHLPNGEVVNTVWDGEGNVFSLSGWPGKSMALPPKPEPIPEPAPEPEPVLDAGPRLTVAGYQVEISHEEAGQLFGTVGLPNGERVAAIWDAASGAELGGRPKFRLAEAVPV